MATKQTVAQVKLWGDVAGSVAWLDDRGYAIFEYDPDFLKKNLEVSPLEMSLDEAQNGDGIFMFPELSRKTFWGLPGLLANSLPDRFGNKIITAWLARNGRSPGDFNPVERLCYVGTRGIGALEFQPQINPAKLNKTTQIEITKLLDLAQEALDERTKLETELGTAEKENAEALLDILRVGTSAGGAKPKAVIAMNQDGRVLSGQSDVPDDYDYWIIKFDGVSDEEGSRFGEPQGLGRIEYAYYLMAKAAGIEMTECRLLEEHGRAHFITRRFDRQAGEKIHLQSLCCLAHFDWNPPGAYGYEQVFMVMRALGLNHDAMVQQYKRMVFNALTHNMDDHTKNIAFLMDKKGRWTLSPAYDLTYSYSPGGKFTNRHQMSINGKRDGFTLNDFRAVGEKMELRRPEEDFEEVLDAVNKWPDFANQAGVNQESAKAIGTLHLDLGDLDDGPRM